MRQEVKPNFQINLIEWEIGDEIYLKADRFTAVKTKTNKTGFRPVSRQQQDRFRNNLFLPTFLGMLFGMLFWVCSTKVVLFWVCSTKVMLFWVWVYCTFLGGGGSVKVFLGTACCCQKHNNNFKNDLSERKSEMYILNR